MMETLTTPVERLHELLTYDPTTGIFRWRGVGMRPQDNARLAGKIAGSVLSSGYRRICVDQITFLAHRIAWVMHYGRWPITLIDHRNGNPRDNRIENLREASHSQNLQNARPHSNKGTRLKGVYFDGSKPRKKPYRAEIETAAGTLSLGYFLTAEEGHAAYAAKARELFGEFARTE